MSAAETEPVTTRRLPVQTLLPAFYTVVVAGVVLLDAIDGPFRLLLIAPLVGFLPGYAILDSVFPALGLRGSRTDEAASRDARVPVELGARVAMAVGLSAVVVPLLFVGFALLGIAITTTSVTLGIAAVCLGGLLTGMVRRRGHPDGGGVRPLVGRWRAELADATVGAESRLDAVLTVVVLVVIVGSMTGFAFGLAAPERGVDYTEVALLDSNNETQTAGNYPETVLDGTPVDLTLTVANHEGRQTDYSVFVVLERVRTTNGAQQVLEREVLDRRATSVSDDATWVEPLRVQPGLLGENLRLSVYVLEGADREVSAVTDADHHLYVWIDVRPASTNGSTSSAASNRRTNAVPG